MMCLYEQQGQETYFQLCAPSEDSDQPAIYTVSIATDKALFFIQKMLIFSYFSTKTYIVGTH